MAEIATALNRSVPSLENVLSRARKNLEARTNAHLVSKCIAEGLLEWNPDDEVRYVNDDDE